MAKYEDAEKVKLLIPKRVREYGSDKAVAFKAGDVVTVAGSDKMELVSTNAGVVVVAEEAKKGKKE